MNPANRYNLRSAGESTSTPTSPALDPIPPPRRHQSFVSLPTTRLDSQVSNTTTTTSSTVSTAVPVLAAPASSSAAATAPIPATISAMATSSYLSSIKLEPFHRNQFMDVDTWLEQFERLGARENVSEEQKYLDLQYCLKGNAGIWFSTEAVNNPEINDYKTLKEALSDRFSTIDKDEIPSVKQCVNESVEQYYYNFMCAVKPCRLTEGHKVNLFIKGLNSQASTYVKLESPTTLEAARKKAVNFEKATLDQTPAKVAAAQPVNNVSAEELSEKVIDIVVRKLEHLYRPRTRETREPYRSQAPARGRGRGFPSTSRNGPPPNNNNRMPQGNREYVQQPAQQPSQNYGRQEYCPTCQGSPLREPKTGGMLFWILTFLICFSQPAACKESLSRLNYGVVFKNTADLHLANENWVHTFEIPIPEKRTLPGIGNCHRDNNTCIMVSHVLAQINTIRAETSFRIEDTVEAIMRLLPEIKGKMARRRRSLLPFIGQLSKSLFGTATEEQVNMLARHVNAITRKTVKILDALEQHGSHLSSFMQTTNSRMDNLIKGIKTNQIEISYVHNLITSTTNNLQSNFNHMIETLVSQINQSSHLNHILDEYKNGIVSLAEGELSPIIVPVEVMNKTMADIQNLLNTKYQGFYITYKTVQQVYSQAKFVCGRYNGSIFISVNLPLTVQKNPIKLYKVISLPVPVNSSSSLGTQILDLPYYFAITSDRQYYMTLGQNELMNCHGTIYIHCSENKPLIPVTSKGCSLALFSNDKELVHSSCNFRLVHNAIEPRLIELDQNAVLLYRTPLLSVECKNQHKMMQGCDFCIINVPCQCSVMTAHLYLPQRLIACQNETTDISMIHHVNLVLLQKFFDRSFYDHIFADSAFVKPVNISLPHFKLYKHEMHSVLADDEKSHLNLSRMVDVAKQDTAAFQSLTEPLLEGLIDLKQDWPDLNSILIFSTMGVTVGLVLLAVWHCTKIRKLLAAVAILKKVTGVDASTSPVPAFIYKATPKPMESSPIPEINIDLSRGHAILFVCILHFLLVLYTYCNKHLKDKKTLLFLELTSGDSCIILPVLTLPLCPAFCKIQAPSDIANFNIKGPWYNRRLTFSWPDLRITDSRTDKDLQVPSTVGLSWTQNLKIRKLFKNPFFVFVYIKHKGHMIAVTSEHFGPNFSLQPMIV